MNTTARAQQGETSPAAVMIPDYDSLLLQAALRKAFASRIGRDTAPPPSLPPLMPENGGMADGDR